MLFRLARSGLKKMLKPLFECCKRNTLTSLATAKQLFAAPIWEAREPTIELLWVH